MNLFPSCMHGSHRGKKRMLDPLDLELLIASYSGKSKPGPLKKVNALKTEPHFQPCVDPIL